jgi:ribosomal-protein-alanine N-acetyltransferase
VGVGPQFRRKGVAQNLINGWIQQHAPSRILLDVHEKNLAARNLYEKLGFTLVGRRPKYYPDGDQALVLERDLTP